MGTVLLYYCTLSIASLTNILIDSKSIPLLARSLPLDTKVNLIIGALTIVIGILSTILAWATWRLTRDRRLRRGHQSEFVHGTSCKNGT
jgi:hypothetical protein